MTEPRTQPLEGRAKTGQALGPIGFTAPSLLVSSCLWEAFVAYCILTVLPVKAKKERQLPVSET